MATLISSPGANQANLPTESSNSLTHSLMDKAKSMQEPAEPNKTGQTALLV